MRNYSFTCTSENGMVVNVTIPHTVLQEWLIDNDLLPPASEPADPNNLETLVDNVVIRWLVADLFELLY